MAESFPSTGFDLPSPTLSARLRELAAYLAAPTAERLTEEQRALALGIARRLVATLARDLDVGIDGAALWDDWLAGGHHGSMGWMDLQNFLQHKRVQIVALCDVDANNLDKTELARLIHRRSWVFAPATGMYLPPVI